MIANTQIRTETVQDVIAERGILHMLNIQEILKRNNNTLYLVYRKNWYETSARKDGTEFTVNVGPYVVEEIFCDNEEDLNKTISNFSYILQSDEMSTLTVSRYYAYGTMCRLNYRIYEEIEDCLYNIPTEDDMYLTDYVNGICYNLIENRNRGR